MRNRVIAIGLDAAEPSVVDAWMNEGKLPTIGALRERGIYGRLSNSEIGSAETPWTNFATGVWPQTSGYWSPLRYAEQSYCMETKAAYDYQEYPLFYAHPDLNCIIFDMPQVRVDPRVNGLQVTAWGAHSPQSEQESIPSELIGEILQQYGPHPALHNDYAISVDVKSTLAVEERLLEGIAKRGRICHDLMKREDWDLFLTVFGEAHAAGHNFSQFSQKSHPLYDSFRPRVSHDPMLLTFETIDKAIGQILESAPDDAVIIVFSAHGMGPNTSDLPSGTFLAELMYRYSFPGETALAAGDYGTPVPAPVFNMDWKYWERHVWNTKTHSTAMQRMMRKVIPNQLISQLEPYFENLSGEDLLPPITLRKLGTSTTFLPATWFMPLWPKMKAFALPSFSEGYVRLNLKGREPNGIVEPDNYDAACEEIIEKIGALTCARTGRKMARDIVRTRKQGDNRNPKLPDGDIIVLWQEEYATDVVESKEYGRIGPVPYYRSGGHRHEGFMVAAGGSIPKSKMTFRGHAMDLPATILDLIGVQVPEHIEGRPLDFSVSNVA